MRNCGCDELKRGVLKCCRCRFIDEVVGDVVWLCIGLDLRI
jgi:hypothetical protein